MDLPEGPMRTIRVADPSARPTPFRVRGSHWLARRRVRDRLTPPRVVPWFV
jgi:hypothetical protein